MVEVNIGPDDRFELKASVLSSRVADEMVLLDGETAVYFGLDHVGAMIFDLLHSQKSMRDVHAQMVATYDAEAATLWNDLVCFLRRLIELNLVSRLSQ